MSKQKNRLANRRLKSSYVSTVMGISLVLFMLGLLGMIILHAKKLSNYVKENIEITVFLKDNVKEVDIAQFQKFLDASEFVKTTEYITKDQAAEKLQSDLGEDFIKFLGFNPLFSSIDIHLHAEYTTIESLQKITDDLSKNSLVKEVYYQKSLVNLVNENIKSISLIILVFTSLLAVIAIALINNTIRLSLYSKRFLIKSMQLVGATQTFIRKPFIIKSLIHGFYAGIIANILLIVILYLAQQEVPELLEIEDVKLFAILFLSVFIFGILISSISTYFAVSKYLKIKLDDLYY